MRARRRARDQLELHALVEAVVLVGARQQVARRVRSSPAGGRRRAGAGRRTARRCRRPGRARDARRSSFSVTPRLTLSESPRDWRAMPSRREADVRPERGLEAGAPFVRARARQRRSKLPTGAPGPDAGDQRRRARTARTRRRRRGRSSGRGRAATASGSPNARRRAQAVRVARPGGEAPSSGPASRTRAPTRGATVSHDAHGRPSARRAAAASRRTRRA